MSILFLKAKMTSDRVAVRILFTYLAFIAVFLAVASISYYLLPQGMLRNRNPLQSWQTSGNLAVSTLQIVSYNLVSVAVLLFANLFSVRKKNTYPFMPVGYSTFFVLIALNGMVLGTWSFSVVTEAVPLLDRLLRTFDVTRRAGLWEMSGQLLIMCGTAKISLVLTDGRKTVTRSWRTIRFYRQEKAAVLLGLLLMLTGAFIESRSILAL